MNKFRGFIAIDIKAVTKVIEFQNEIRNTGANIKIVEPENIHITLKFLGETEESLIDKINDIIKESVKGITPFEVTLKDTGVFPNENYIKVIWIGIEKFEEIRDIANNIDEKLINLGFKKEKRKFSPHITIARVKSAKNKENLIQVINKFQDVEFTKFSVNSIKLKKSELTKKGPIYTTLKEIEIK